MTAAPPAIACATHFCARHFRGRSWSVLCDAAAPPDARFRLRVWAEGAPPGADPVAEAAGASPLNAAHALARALRLTDAHPADAMA